MTPRYNNFSIEMNEEHSSEEDLEKIIDNKNKLERNNTRKNNMEQHI